MEGHSTNRFEAILFLDLLKIAFHIVFYVKVGGEQNYIYSFCAKRSRIDVSCPRFHIGPDLGSVAAGIYRSAVSGSQAVALDPSDYGLNPDTPWLEWNGEQGWREGQVCLDKPKTNICPI
jgi:hypothetical protein